MSAPTQPDYEKLRAILERELGRTVSLEYATQVGKTLIGIYDVLLYGKKKSAKVVH